MEINDFILRPVGSHRTNFTQEWRDMIRLALWKDQSIPAWVQRVWVSLKAMRVHLVPCWATWIWSLLTLLLPLVPVPILQAPQLGIFYIFKKNKAIPVHVLPLFSFKLWLKPGSRSLKAPEKKMISMVAVTMGNPQTNSHPCTPQCPISSQLMWNKGSCSAHGNSRLPVTCAFIPSSFGEKKKCCSHTFLCSQLEKLKGEPWRGYILRFLSQTSVTYQVVLTTQEQHTSLKYVKIGFSMVH